MRMIVILILMGSILGIPLYADELAELKSDAAEFAKLDSYRNLWGITGLVVSLVVAVSAYIGLKGYNPDIMMYISAFTVGLGTFILSRTALIQPEIEMSGRTELYKNNIRNEIRKQMIRNRIVYLLTGAAGGAASLLIIQAMPINK